MDQTEIMHQSGMAEYGVFKAALKFSLMGSTRKSGFRLIGTSIRWFFFPQFTTKFGIKKRPVVRVDHPLDENIPFLPDQVKIYLTFIHYWLKAAGFIHKEFGKQSLPKIGAFMDDLSLLYEECGKLYDICQSTTDRPKNSGGFFFNVIHSLDPHLHCVPSLHIAVVCYSWFQMNCILNELAGEDSYDKEREYLWKNGMAINNSILLIKQHSVNCISAGLFCLSKLFPDFSTPQAVLIIDSLLAGTGLSDGVCKNIRDYVHDLYRRFTREGETAPWNEVVLRFLHSYSDAPPDGAGPSS